MKSARNEKTSVMEKRGLKENLILKKTNDGDEDIDTKVKILAVSKSSEKKTESFENALNSSIKIKNKSKQRKLSKFQIQDSLINVTSRRKKKELNLKEQEKIQNRDHNVNTRSKRANKQKITDLENLNYKKLTNSNNQVLVIKQDKKSDLIIPLKLQNDANSHITPEIPIVKEENEDKIKKTKVDFFTLDIKDLDYSNISRVFFNFKDNIEKNKELSKVNVILAIYEIALNQNFYGLQNYSNKTISFWNNVKNQSYIGCFFSYFTAETIRKYWRELSSIKSIETLVDVLTNKAKEIDTNEIKLLPLIKLLKDYINNNSTGFEELLLGIDKRKTKSKKVDEKEKNNMNLKKKRNRHIEEEEEEIDPLEVYKILNNTETQYKNEITIDKKLDAIKEIIESFYICFNKALKKEFILDALKMNSMNIQKTYEFLYDPNAKKEHIFNEYEDNIIMNLKDTKLFKGLIDSKGDVAVKEREEFLKIEY